MKLSLAPAMLLWGAYLAILTLVGIVFFGVDVPTPLLLGGAAAAVLAGGLLLGIRGLGRPYGDTVVAPGESPPTVWLAIALALLAVSATVGAWLAFVAAGMVGLGVGGLVRELRAQRRQRELLGEGFEL